MIPKRDVGGGYRFKLKIDGVERFSTRMRNNLIII